MADGFLPPLHGEGVGAADGWGGESKSGLAFDQPSRPHPASPDGRPAGAGTVEPMGGATGVTVNVTVDGGAEGLLRSETQIARMLARATALGAR